MILSLKTSEPEAELALLDGDKELASKRWLAGRELSRTLLGEIEALLKSRGAGWSDLTGVVIFPGPGSFTGLRIGFSVANAIAYAQDIQISADGGKNWQAAPVLPHYGAPAKITLPKAK